MTDTAFESRAAQVTEQIIERFGGIRPMAAKLDTPVTTVQGWKKRGVIPTARHADILAAASRENIELDPADLAATDPGGISLRPEASPVEAEQNFTPPRTRQGLARAAFVLSLVAIVAAAAAGGVGWKLLISPMQKRIAALETRVAAAEPGNELARRIDVLESEIAQRAPPPAPAGAPSDAAAADRISALEQQVAQIRSTGAEAEQLTKHLADVQIAANGRELLAQSIRDIQSSIAAIQGEVERQAEQAKSVSGRLDQVDTQLAQRRQQALRAEAVVLAVGQLRAAVRDLKPFKKDVTAVHAITTDDREIGAVLDQLQPYAETGVATHDQLRADFGRLAPDIVRSEVVGDGSSWWRQALYRLSSVISVRRVGDSVPGDRTDAIVARAEAKLEEDDIESALSALKALTGLPRDVAVPWMKDAEERLAVDRAETELTRLAIDRVSTGTDPGGRANADQPQDRSNQDRSTQDKTQ